MKFSQGQVLHIDTEFQIKIKNQKLKIKNQKLKISLTRECSLPGRKGRSETISNRKIVFKLNYPEKFRVEKVYKTPIPGRTNFSVINP